MEKNLKSLWHLMAIISLAFIFFISCQKDNDDPDYPVSFEWVEVDYITATTAYFAFDIFGETDLLTRMGFVYNSTGSPGLNDQVLEADSVRAGIYGNTAVGLFPGQTYYARAFYIYDGEEYLDDEIRFTTTVTAGDLEGNAYETVKIGTQLWLQSNLRTVLYNNGDSIDDGTGLRNYTDIAEPAFYFQYADDPDYREPYGLLYTWYVAADERGVCPSGFRVPDMADWESLILHLDALAVRVDDLTMGSMELSSVAGGMLKSMGTLDAGNGLWEHPNGGANNITQMDVLPAGIRDPSGAFDGLGLNTAFWSFTEESESSALMFYIHYFNSGIYSNHFNKKSGYSLRCMREADL